MLRHVSPSSSSALDESPPKILEKRRRRPICCLLSSRLRCKAIYGDDRKEALMPIPELMTAEEPRETLLFVPVISALRTRIVLQPSRSPARRFDLNLQLRGHSHEN